MEGEGADVVGCDQGPPEKLGMGPRLAAGLAGAGCWPPAGRGLPGGGGV